MPNIDRLNLGKTHAKHHSGRSATVRKERHTLADRNSTVPIRGPKTTPTIRHLPPPGNLPFVDLRTAMHGKALTVAVITPHPRMVPPRPRGPSGASLFRLPLYLK